MSAKKISDSTFDSEVLSSDKPVVVDFWAEWCGPCKMISPSIDELAAEMGEQVQIVKVNIDDNPDTPTKYGVRGIPTLMMFKNGETVSTKVGALPKGQIQEWIEENV